MYGSRWSSPMCPGISIYKDDLPTGGKICTRPDYSDPKKSIDFQINKDGFCAERDKDLCASTVANRVAQTVEVAGGLTNIALAPVTGALAAFAGDRKAFDYAKRQAEEGLLTIMRSGNALK